MKTSAGAVAVRIAPISFLILCCLPVAPAAPAAIVPINKESIADLRKRYPLASAEVDDPVYKRKQRYEGFWLRDVLLGLDRGGRAEAGLYVRFRCKDGYLPLMPLTRAMGAEGLIAIRDRNAPHGEDWQPLPAPGTPATPAPAYLVWVAPPGDPEEYPWPYQVVAIELVSASDALAGLDAPASRQGRELFVTHCLKCHAINGVGGTFGPELNSPCSVTEYWNPRLLERFIANAASVRAGTRMPRFDTLPPADIQAIIDYLKGMARSRKSGAACP